MNSIVSDRRLSGGVMATIVLACASTAIVMMIVVELRGQAPPALATGAVSVTAGRPLYTMADVLETRYGWIVTYEDAPWLNQQLDLVDDASEETRSAGRRSWSAAPRRIDLPDGLEIAPDAPDLFARIFAAHEAADGAGRFRVLQRSATMFHIVPTQARSSRGAWVPVTPLLDTPVSFAAMDRTFWDALEQLCAELSRSSGSRVWPAIPTMGAQTKRTRIGASGEKARHVLLRLVTEWGTPLTWRFTNIPFDGSWALGIAPPGMTKYDYDHITGNITPVKRAPPDRPR